MKLPRPSTEADRLELKAATRHALELAGRANTFAMVTRVEPPALSKYASPAEMTAFMPVDVVLDLDREIGAPMLTQALARMLGYRLVPIEPDAAGTVGLEDLAEVQRETGDVVQKLATALPDGIDAQERRELKKEIGEGIASLHRLDRKLGRAA